MYIYTYKGKANQLGIKKKQTHKAQADTVKVMQ